MSQVLTQMQDFITVLFLGAALIVFNPWLILILVLAVIPSFLGETHFNQASYSLTRSWTPERRELDYLRYIGASDQTAKEVKIFNLSQFLADRFRRPSRFIRENNRGTCGKHATDSMADRNFGTVDLRWRCAAHLPDALLQRVHPVHAGMHVGQTAAIGVER